MQAPIAADANLDPPVERDAPSSDVVLSADDRRARFTALYNAHFDYVWNVVRRLGVPSQHIADVTHDVFVTVFNKLDEYDPSRPPKPWLFAVAFRVTRNQQRLAHNRNERLSAGEEPLDSIDPQPSAEDGVGVAQERAMLREALDTLDVERRAVLMLHDVDEKPASEIAALCAIPVKTVYSRLYSARSLLLAAVARFRARRGER